MSGREHTRIDRNEEGGGEGGGELSAANPPPKKKDIQGPSRPVVFAYFWTLIPFTTYCVQSNSDMRPGFPIMQSFK